MQKVIFACVHNAGRSQMAAACFNLRADPRRALALSAGTSPASAVHPVVVTAMAERGVDLSNAKPRLLTAELARDAAMLITMGCGDACPVLPRVAREDWPLADPKGQRLEAVRALRDDIERRVQALIDARGWSR